MRSDFSLYINIHEGATPRGWFVSEVLRGDRRTTHGTRDGFQSPRDFGGGCKVDQKRSERRGALLLSLLSAAPALPTGAGGCVNRPYHVQKVLRTIPVAFDDRQKKLIGLWE